MFIKINLFNLFLKAYQTPSVMSTNPLTQSTYTSQEKILKPTDQSKKRFIANPIDTNRSFALYNQKNGRIGKFNSSQ